MLEIVQRHPEYQPGVFLGVQAALFAASPINFHRVGYAHWLAENDKFEEAQKAFRTAGHEDKAVDVSSVLMNHNAIGHFSCSGSQGADAQRRAREALR